MTAFADHTRVQRGTQTYSEQPKDPWRSIGELAAAVATKLSEKERRSDDA